MMNILVAWFKGKCHLKCCKGLIVNVERYGIEAQTNGNDIWWHDWLFWAISNRWWKDKSWWWKEHDKKIYLVLDLMLDLFSDTNEDEDIEDLRGFVNYGKNMYDKFYPHTNEFCL